MTSMLRSRVRPLVVVAIMCALGLLAPWQPLGAQGKTNGRRWVATWATGAASRPAAARDGAAATAPAAAQTPPAAAQRGAAASSSIPGPIVAIDLNDQTLRQIVHTSVGGDRARVVFSNAFGTAPLMIGGAHLALRRKEAAIAPGSGRPLLFGGERSATIPAGAIMVSDTVDIAVPADADLAIDLYFPGNTQQSESPVTLHNRGYQTNYVSRPGNHTGADDLPVMTTTPIWHWLARVEVTAPDAYAIVALGDSITDGFGSTMDANSRWPDELGKRLRANSRTRHASVINVGIGGNRILGEMNPGFGVNALARFDRDVLAQPGATHIIVLEGINDIGMARRGSGPTAAVLIAAHRQLIERAHARGFRIYGATLTPFEGAGSYSAEGETVRTALNDWIRTGGVYDGVIDFDAAVRDPQRPTRFLPGYHAGDFLHPNSAGYRAMADAADLKLFEAKHR
jgi:lysophospholipase L1-like esterase